MGNGSDGGDAVVGADDAVGSTLRRDTLLVHHMRPWSPELEFVARCSRPTTDPRDLDRAQQLAQRDLDWVRVSRVADHHGLAALVDATLRTHTVPGVPATVLDELRTLRRRRTINDLRLADRWREIHQALDTHGIRAVTLKGLHLVLTVYREIGLRPVGDFDLLVAPHDIARTLDLLAALGYSLYPDWDRARRNVGLAHILDHTGELSLSGPDATIIDLHWRTSERATAFDTTRLLDTARSITYRDQRIGVLDPATTLAFVLSHGHRSAWARLRWLVDVAELVEQSTDADVARAAELIDETGLSEAWDSAAPLAQSLWHRPWRGPQRRAPRVARTAYLQRTIEREAQPMYIFDAWRPIRMLTERWHRRHSLIGAVRSALRPNHFDWATVALPRPLRGGYTLVRPARLLVQAARVARTVPVRPTRAVPPRTTDVMPHAPRVPLTFTTAIFDSGPTSFYGGRGRGVEYFVSTLINIRNLGGDIVIYGAPDKVDHIRAVVAPELPNAVVRPFALESFEFYDAFVRSKQAYLPSLPINDRNELLCYAKSYLLARTIADDPFGNEHHFWIDAGLTHHGIFPLRVGGVEMLVSYPPSHYFPHNPANIFTPTLGRAIRDAAPRGRLFCCANPARPGTVERAFDESVAAVASGDTRAPASIDTHIIGGLFGGHAADALAFHEAIRPMLERCLRLGVRTLEEQVFSALHAREPERFAVQHFGTWYFYSPGEPNSFLKADDDSFFKVFTRLAAAAPRHP